MTPIASPFELPAQPSDQPFDPALEAQISAQLAEFSASKVSWDLKLERIRALLARLDNPQTQVPIVHVAGTNGKGSVCAYVSSVLTAAGYRTGRYTSPHLVSWTERLVLNDRPLPPRELTGLIEEVASQARSLSHPAGCPSQFEVITAVAWLYFARAAVDVAVVEVGLGGRLDATNVVDRPLASAITSIGFDHCSVLGHSLGEIASEKAGILKPGGAAVVGPVAEETWAAIAAQAQAVGARLVRVQPAVPVAAAEAQRADLSPEEQGRVATWVRYEGRVYPLSLAGAVQYSNGAVAIALVDLLRAGGMAIPEAALRRGLAAARWPGRLQRISWPYNNQTYSVLVDGAHNVDAAIALRQFVDQEEERRKKAEGREARPVTWVIGLLRSKDVGGILAALLRSGDRLVAVPIADPATLPVGELLAVAEKIAVDLGVAIAAESGPAGLAAALALVEGDDPPPPLVLCGSLYLLGEILQPG